MMRRLLLALVLLGALGVAFGLGSRSAPGTPSYHLTESPTTSDRVTMLEARNDARTVGAQFADMFVEDKPRIQVRCHRLAIDHVRCPTILIAPGLAIRYDTHVMLWGKTHVGVYFRNVRILKQPNTPMP